MGVRNNFGFRIARVQSRLEDLNSLARDAGAADPADQLFALAGEHGTAYGFNPAGVRDENFQC